MSKANKKENLKDQIDKSAKLFDVAQPGKTAASSTSRPVIVGHKSQAKDPMVVEDPKEDNDQPSKSADEQPAKVLKPKRATVIAPLDNSIAKEEKKPEEPDEPAEPVEVEEPKEDKAQEEAEPKSSDAANVAAVAESVDSKQALKKEKRELEDRNAEIESLIESKQFYVPIGQVTKRRRMNFFLIILLLMVLAAVIALNFAIDAEILDIGFAPLTDIL